MLKYPDAVQHNSNLGRKETSCSQAGFQGSTKITSSFPVSAPFPCRANQTKIWTTQLDISKGLWLVEIFTYFDLRNVLFRVQLIADGSTTRDYY